MRLSRLGPVALAVGCLTGCGGDAYESQFKASLDQLKATGQPIPRLVAPVSPEVAAEIEKLKGTWQAVSLQYNGEEHPQQAAQFRYTFTDKMISFALGQDAPKSGPYQIDPTKTPKEIETLSANGADAKNALGIYELDGDTLKLCVADAGGVRPDKFADGKDSGRVLVVFKRAQGEKK